MITSSIGEKYSGSAAQPHNRLIERRERIMRLLIATIIATAAGSANAAIINIDFSTEDDFITPLVNGQSVESPDEFGNLFNLNVTGGGSGGNDGLAIFDTSDPGPNDSGPDPDLLVNLGNALIFQNNGSSQTGDIFDTPNDDAGGGSMRWTFLSPVEMLSLDLIDINGGGQQVDVILTDGLGRTRTYDVPSLWTNDIDSEGPLGYDTLDLTTLAGQLGEGGSTATAFEDAGFDITDVTTMDISFAGSGGLDNVRFIPTPGTTALLAMGGIAAIRRRR